VLENRRFDSIPEGKPVGENNKVWLTNLNRNYGVTSNYANNKESNCSNSRKGFFWQFF